MLMAEMAIPPSCRARRIADAAGSRKLFGIVYGPDQSVSIDQNQNEDSQTSGGSASMSPTISITPLSLPMNSRSLPAGTNFATGLPRLVITSVSRVLLHFIHKR